MLQEPGVTVQLAISADNLLGNRHHLGFPWVGSSNVIEKSPTLCGLGCAVWAVDDMQEVGFKVLQQFIHTLKALIAVMAVEGSQFRVP